jgi:magnesium chelatase family protein
MNPCPCGNKGSKQKQCICKQNDLDRYTRKISGPIIDRIDIWVTVGNVDFDKLSSEEYAGEKTKSIKERVAKARVIQEKRFSAKGGSASGGRSSARKIKTNSEMNVKDLAIFAPLSPEIKQLLNQSAERLQLSARAYHRVIKLARTIADLEGTENISTSHILEALQYRPREN